MSLLHIRLVEAVGLPSSDFNGFADPYCKVYLENVTHLSENKIFKSEAKKKCTDPIFDCAASLNVSPKDLRNGLIMIDIFDHDIAKKSDDELGYASLPLSYFYKNNKFEGWLPVRSKKKKQQKQIQKTAKIEKKKSFTEQFESPQLHYLNGSHLPTTPSPKEQHIKKPVQHNKDLQSIDLLTLDDNILPNNDIIGSTLPLHVETSTHQNAENEKQKKLAAVSEEFIKTRGVNLESARTESFANNGIIAKSNSYCDYAVTSSISRQTNNDRNTLYDIPRETLLGDEILKNVTPNAHNHGKRNCDSGRIFIVVDYQKQFHFGKMSNSEVKKTRKSNRNLKVFNSFCDNIPINVFCLSFNAGNCSLSDFAESMPEWLPNDGSVDLYALAFQELNQRDHDQNEENKEDEVAAAANKNQQSEIERHFLSHLAADYVTIAHYKMWQTRLFLFTKEKYFDLISNVVSHHEVTGIANIVKNKGGVAISLDFDGISLCFLSCHLAAHQSKCRERNAMYTKICKNIKVGMLISTHLCSFFLLLCCSISGWPKQPLLGQFHFLLFMGDLNYRVDYFGQQQSDKPDDEIFTQVCQIIKEIATTNSSKQQKNDRKSKVDKSMITGGGQLKREQLAYSGLLKCDQLKISMEQRRAFVGFQEHGIKFPPTFKTKRKVGIHYISQRLPAWCDRILWRAQDSIHELMNDKSSGFKATNYRIYDKVSISDHKPVSCSFVLPSWPRPCGISDECTKAILHFKDVCAHNLIPSDVNGKSDPFIHFPRQLMLEKHVQSKRVNKTLNPQWKDKYIKELVLIRNSLPFLQKALLLFQIRDHDTFTADDLIGCGCIELKKCVQHLNKWVEFKEFLTLHGKDAGVFEGKIKLEYKVKKRKSTVSDNE